MIGQCQSPPGWLRQCLVCEIHPQPHNTGHLLVVDILYSPEDKSKFNQTISSKHENVDKEKCPRISIFLNSNSRWDDLSLIVREKVCINKRFKS